MEKRRNGDAAERNNIGLCIRRRWICGQGERKRLSLLFGIGGAAGKNASSEEHVRKASHFLGGFSNSDSGFGGLLNNTEEGRCSKL